MKYILYTWGKEQTEERTLLNVLLAVSLTSRRTWPRSSTLTFVHRLQPRNPRTRILCSFPKYLRYCLLSLGLRLTCWSSICSECITLFTSGVSVKDIWKASFEEAIMILNLNLPTGNVYVWRHRRWIPAESWQHQVATSGKVNIHVNIF